MMLPVEEDVPSDPRDVGLLGGAAVVAGARASRTRLRIRGFSGSARVVSRTASEGKAGTLVTALAKPERATDLILPVAAEELPGPAPSRRKNRGSDTLRRRNPVLKGSPEALEAPRTVPCRLHVRCDRSRRLDLLQAAEMVAGSLQHLLQRLPGSALDSIGVTETRLASEARWDSRIRRDERWNVPKEPSFQFLDGEPVDDPEWTTLRSGARAEAHGSGGGLKLRLEPPAVLVVFVDDDHDSVPLGQPVTVATQAGFKLLEEITLALVGMDVEALPWEDLGDEHPERRLHGRLLDQEFEVLHARAGPTISFGGSVSAHQRR